MLHVAVLVCSDYACAERTTEVGTLPELESLACDCGWGLLVVGWATPLARGSSA